MTDSSPMTTTQRVLDIVPIVHTEADLGGASDAARAATINALGHDAWEQKQQAVAAFWRTVTSFVESIPDVDSWVVFQDGLPQCPPEALNKIVDDLAGNGSTNHELLKALRDRGATLVGPESAELLMKEYELVKQSLASANGQASDPRTTDRSRTILEARDRFIARVINETLTHQTRGLLLIGLLHNVEPYLDEDIQVNTPLGRPTIETPSDTPRRHAS